MPYDLAARDLPLWSVFPVSTQPFCVRSRIDDFDSDSMWRDFDHVVRDTPDRNTTQLAISESSAAAPEASTRDDAIADDSNEKPEPRMAEGTAEAELGTLPAPSAESRLADNSVPTPSPSLAHCGFADYRLDEIIWQVEAMVAANSRFRSAIAPQSIGKTIASIVSGSTQFVERAAVRIATRWPNAERKPKRSPAGARLLARAGAIDADILPAESIAPDATPGEWSFPTDFPATQIAELPGAIQHR